MSKPDNKKPKRIRLTKNKKLARNIAQQLLKSFSTPKNIIPVIESLKRPHSFIEKGNEKENENEIKKHKPTKKITFNTSKTIMVGKDIMKTNADPNFEVDLLVLPPIRDSSLKPPTIVVPPIIKEKKIPAYLNLIEEPSPIIQQPYSISGKYGVKTLNEFFSRSEVSQQLSNWVSKAISYSPKEKFHISNKVCFLYGPLGSGKTTLVNLIAKHYNLELQCLHSDNITNSNRLFESAQIVNLKAMFPFMILVENIDSLLEIQKNYEHLHSEENFENQIDQPKSIGIIGNFQTFCKSLSPRSFPVIITCHSKSNRLVRDWMKICKVFQLPAPNTLYCQQLATTIVNIERSFRYTKEKDYQGVLNSGQLFKKNESWQDIYSVVDNCEGNIIKLFNMIEFILNTESKFISKTELNKSQLMVSKFYYDNSKNEIFDYAKHWLSNDRKTVIHIDMEQIENVMIMIATNCLGCYVSRNTDTQSFYSHQWRVKGHRVVLDEMPLLLNFLNFFQQLFRNYQFHQFRIMDTEYAFLILSMIRTSCYTPHNRLINNEISWPKAYKSLQYGEKKQINIDSFDFWADHKNTEETQFYQQIYRSKFASMKKKMEDQKDSQKTYESTINRLRQKGITSQYISFLYEGGEAKISSLNQAQALKIAKQEANFWIETIIQQSITRKKY